MAKNALTLFNNNGAVAIPDHIQKFMDEEGGNITGRETVPSLTYGGKVWTIAMNGEKTKLVKKNDDGDEEPRQIMRVVILDYAKRRGRAYYEGAYDPDKPGAPVCWSDDGVEPHENVKDPQCSTCAKCPMAAKGSKVTEGGKAVKACAEHRMLAVVPANDLAFQPLRLKLAITSDWDAQSPDLEAKGWRAFQNYTDNLKAQGLQHTAAIVTKMKFDPGVDYPKVVFSADRWLENDEVAQIVPVVKSDEVKGLLNATWTPAGADGVKNTPKDEPADEPKATKAAKPKSPPADEEEETAPPPKAKAKPAPKAAEEEDDLEIPASLKRTAKPAAKPAAKAAEEEADDDESPPPKAKGKTPQVEEDDEEEAPPPKKRATAETARDTTKPHETSGKSKPKADLPEEVAALLEEWGDD